ncbi:ornithine decarboxylase [Nannochloropsis oceanica]
MAEVQVDTHVRRSSLDLSMADELSGCGAVLLGAGPLSPRVLHPPPTDALPTVRTLLEQKALHEGLEDAFFVADLGAIIRQHRKWQRCLPRVEPFYAIKCNTDPEVLRTLLPLCAGFDCASKGEIETMLALGVNPSNIIYANPCKPPEHVRYARDHGVHLMTFDNADELAKVKAINPNAKMVLRILTDDSKSVCRFGTKFGAHLPATLPLLQTARHLGMDVVGVSFHVGSGCQDPMAFDDAVRRAKRVFEEGARLGYHLTLLDVGGGFPGSEKRHSSEDPDIHGKAEGSVTFEEIAAVLGKAIQTHFPDPAVRVIAEPGRFYVAPAFTLATTITSRRAVFSDAMTAADDSKLEGRASAAVAAGGGRATCAGGMMTTTTTTTTTATSAMMIDESGTEGSGKQADHQKMGLRQVQVSSEEKSFMYYVNDGVYGSFNCLLFDHAQAFPKVLAAKSRAVRHKESVWLGDWYECSVWGPTCDSMDCISKKTLLPELAIGDWLYFEEMGAYTLAAASRFNGFELSSVFYTNTEAMP